MTDKSLVIVSLLEQIQQRISHFRSFNSTRILTLTKVLVHLRLNQT